MLNEPASRFEHVTLARLRGLGRRLRLYVMLDGLAAVSLAVVASVLVTLLVDRTLRLAWDMRAVQLMTLLAAIGFVAWRLMAVPFSTRIRAADLAVLIERRYPQLQSRLVTAVEFAGGKAMRGMRRETTCSPAMIEAVIAQAGSQAASLRFEDALNHARARRMAAVVVACLVLLVAMTLAAPRTMGLWFDRNVLMADVEWPQRSRLTLEGEDLADGTMVVARGDDVTVSARVDQGFEPPRQVYIRYESDSGAAGREQIPAILGQVVRFSHTFERIEETLRCQIAGGDAATGWFTLQVVDRPRVSGVRIGIEPPPYIQLDPYELRPGQTVAEVLPGSRVRFDVTTNKPVVQAALVRQIGADSVEVGQVDTSAGTALSGTDRPTTSATYHFRLTDDLGLTNMSERVGPVRFTIRLVADRPPVVKMKVKGAGEMITPQAVLPIETEFADEFAVATTELVYSTSREDAVPVREPVPGFEPPSRTYTHTLDWPVETRGLTEGDRLTLQAEASDYDDVSGPNVGRSSAIVFRVVSRDELLAELNRREQEYRQDFERLLRQQEELYADLLTLIQASPTPGETADRGNDFARLARRQRDHAGRINALRLQFEQVLSELRVNRMSSPAIENRLSGGVIEPMNRLGRTGMRIAAERLDELAAEESPQRVQEARQAQDAVLVEMRAILAGMQKWEGFQEAVILLRDVLKMQRDLIEETETRIESDIFGTEPASRPSDE